MGTVGTFSPSERSPWLSASPPFPCKYIVHQKCLLVPHGGGQHTWKTARPHASMQLPEASKHKGRDAQLHFYLSPLSGVASPVPVSQPPSLVARSSTSSVLIFSISPSLLCGCYISRDGHFVCS